MKPTNRKFKFYLDDMILSMKRIQEYIGDIEEIEFKSHYMIVDAVIRNFEIIGEASKHIPNELKEKYPQIPWSKMYSLRNIIIHEYFGIDHQVIWEIAKNELPKNQLELEKILEREINYLR